MTVVEQRLPFVIEPVSPQRVQLWAAFAAGVTARRACNVVCEAFNALWFEYAVAETYSRVLELLARDWDYSSSVVSWLDASVQELGVIASFWAVVCGLIDEDQALRAHVEQWYQDAVGKRQQAEATRQQVVRYVVRYWPPGRRSLPSGNFSPSSAGFLLNNGIASLAPLSLLWV